MKTLFLDIDGVIANNWSLKQPMDKWLKIDKETAYPFFPAAVEQLNRVLKETDADIVLSSDWRLCFNLTQLDYIFKENGVIKSPIALTSEMSNYWVDHEDELNGKHERDIEIEKYVNENNIQDFAIVDDRVINVYPERFVKTSDSHGLSKKYADRLIEILKNE